METFTNPSDLPVWFPDNMPSLKRKKCRSKLRHSASSYEQLRGCTDPRGWQDSISRPSDTLTLGRTHPEEFLKGKTMIMKRKSKAMEK